MKKQRIRKILALMLGVMMMLGCAGIPAFTANAETLTFAQVQERINNMNNNETLTIEGNCKATASDPWLVIPSGKNHPEHNRNAGPQYPFR